MKRGGFSSGSITKRFRVNEPPVAIPAQYDPGTPYFIFKTWIQGAILDFARTLAKTYPGAFSWKYDFYVNGTQIGSNLMTFVHVPSLHEERNALYIFIPVPDDDTYVEYMRDWQYASEEIADIEAYFEYAAAETDVNCSWKLMFPVAKAVNLTGAGIQRD